MTGPEVRDYGSAGRLGLGTPQANPTVEAEIRRLLPRDVDYFTLRLTSDSSDAATRLRAYLVNLADFIDQRYAGLKLDGLMFACTASEYLLDPTTAQNHVDAAEQRLDAPVFTAARALTSWLHDRQAKTLALITPYPDWLYEPALQYWRTQGFEIIDKAQVAIASADTYGIYDLQSGNAKDSLARLADSGADAVLVSGTGMPSLKLLAEARALGLTIISSNLALVEQALKHLNQTPALLESCS